jgi:endo-1,4-beta-xylanase
MILPFLLLLAQAPVQIRPAYWLDPDRSEPAGTHYKTFQSKLANSEVSYLIYLPPDYETNPTRRYPVMYWLHGLNGGPSAGSFYVRQLDTAIREGKIQPVIAVLVNGMRDSFYCDSPDGKWPVESVIVKELIPAVDREFRTQATREGRGVEGFSMGGFGTAHLGFKYPELFGTVGINSGALLRPEGIVNAKFGNPPLFQKMFGGDKERVLAEDPFELARKNADKIRGKTAIRVAVGGDDSLKVRNEAMHDLLMELKIEHEWEVIPDVAHEMPKFYRLQGAKAFGFYNQVLFRSLITYKAP